MTETSASKETATCVGAHAIEMFRLVTLLASWAPESVCRVHHPRPGNEPDEQVVLWDTRHGIKLDTGTLCEQVADASLLDLRTTCASLSAEDRRDRRMRALASALALFPLGYTPSSFMRTAGDIMSSQLGHHADRYAQEYPALIRQPYATNPVLRPVKCSGSQLLVCWFLMQDYDTRFTLGCNPQNAAYLMSLLEPGSLRLDTDHPGDAPCESWSFECSLLSGTLKSWCALRRAKTQDPEYAKEDDGKIAELLNLMESMAARGVPVGNAWEVLSGNPGLWTRNSLHG